MTTPLATEGMSPADVAISTGPFEHLIVEKNLGRTLDLARHAHGVTMCLTRVYGDANRVVVGYTLAGAGELAALPLLMKEHATELPPLASIGHVGGKQEDESATVGAFITFDGHGIAGSPSEIALRLRAHVRCGRRAAGMNPLASLTFAFTVPFISGRRVVLHQKNDVGEASVTLEQVVATPLETRLYVRGVSAGSARLALVANGRQVPWHASRDDEGLATHSFEPLNDGQNDVTATMSPQSESDPKLDSGPWVFHFTLP